jgi:hypothetical protein
MRMTKVANDCVRLVSAVSAVGAPLTLHKFLRTATFFFFFLMVLTNRTLAFIRTLHTHITGITE